MTVVERLADAIDQMSPDARVLVAIDGPDAAGKTVLADALAQQVARPVLRVSIDDWHNPRKVRLQRGDESPDGYYLDSFDYDALSDHLLHPFRAGSSYLDASNDKTIVQEQSTGLLSLLALRGK